MEWHARADLEELGRAQRGWRRVFSSKKKNLDLVRRGKRAALETCALYLRVQEAERESMREFFRREPLTLPHGRTGLQPLLHWALAEGLRRLRSENDTDGLMLGLAAASLEDCQFDGRDTLTGLGHLWMASVERGHCPRAAFERVGALSSASTGELVGRFEETSHFRVDLAPRLADLGDPSR